ncbi:MAG: DUF1636 domain-containing protein [Acetobacter aceti]|uniref:Metal-binding protein n=1 Tax=Acetobacter aceti TaxID=435 RepID=A0A1U9KCQ5_ACEAC|nr:DUF1636 domain-containing protein [Acetobacter aceti]AQS83519.1 hypothetical protein A0U92_00690 [Acetobacter aceti]
MNDLPARTPEESQVERPALHICVTCLRPDPDGVPLGRTLYETLCDRADAGHVILQPVLCLAACGSGCTATISMPGKWAWLLGHLDPAKADDLLTYAGLYAASKTGAVMPSKRPSSLNDMILGRFPALLPTSQEPT